MGRTAPPTPYFLRCDSRAEQETIGSSVLGCSGQVFLLAFAKPCVLRRTYLTYSVNRKGNDEELASNKHLGIRRTHVTSRLHRPKSCGWQRSWTTGTLGR